MTGHPILDALTVLSDVLVRGVLLVFLLAFAWCVLVALPAEMRAVEARRAARVAAAAGTGEGGLSS